jgi:hypothetical protein
VELHVIASPTQEARFIHTLVLDFKAVITAYQAARDLFSTGFHAKAYDVLQTTLIEKVLAAGPQSLTRLAGFISLKYLGWMLRTAERELLRHKRAAVPLVSLRPGEPAPMRMPPPPPMPAPVAALGEEQVAALEAAVAALRDLVAAHR